LRVAIRIPVVSPSKMSKQQEVTLSNGVVCPWMGFGTAFGNWTDDSKPKGFRPEDAWVATPMALDAGIRHFDCAYLYRTHRHVGITLGKYMAEGKIKREDVFITTKVFHANHDLMGGIKTFDPLTPGIDCAANVQRQIGESLDELGVGYVDLLLLHWPGQFNSLNKTQNRAIREQVWCVLEKALRLGHARAIGVSNWTEEHIADLVADGCMKPMANQIEMSPYTQWTKIITYCQENDIKLMAYSPMGSNAAAVLKDPVIIEIADKHKKNAGQVVLRWLAQQDIMALPRSSSAERIKSNMDVFDFELSAEEMKAITALNKGETITNTNPYSIA